MQKARKNATRIEINLKKLEENYRSFASFGNVYFPVKTNHNDIILNSLKKLGSGFECDCVEHIKKVITSDNCSKIIYSNVAKTTSDIEWALKNGVVFFTIDDGETLERIVSTAQCLGIKEIKINIRLNVYDIFLKEFKERGVEDSRLGSSVWTCRKLLSEMKKENRLKIHRGLSFYVQAEMHDKEDMLLVVADYINNHFKKNDEIEWINIGGGSKASTIKMHLNKFLNTMRPLDVKYIILEPGRYMVDGVEDAYVPCTRVSKKDNGEIVVSINMGIYHGLLDKRLHKRKYDISIVNGKNIEKLVPIKKILYKPSLCKKTKEKEKETNFPHYCDILTDIPCNRLVLRGATADSIDIVGTYALPKSNIQEGTLFKISNIGAYVEVLRSEFSGKMDIDFFSL